MDQQTLKDLFSYSPETGVFVRRKTIANANAGSFAGSKALNGYLCITINYKKYYAHRLAWIYVYGYAPSGTIDHINGIRNDNRIVNLRDVPKSVNNQNFTKPSSRNKSGLLGVRWDKERSKWIASISVNGRTKVIGRFDCREKAHEAYLEKKRILHEGCTI